MDLLPLLSTLTSSLGSLSQVLSTFINVDLNTLIAGGVALNGATPDKLTGYYKYTSAVGGDNGGILILGSKYNTATHKREIVGGGYTVALTDTSDYAPFEVNYTPISDVYPSFPNVEADSLIILMLSSANATPQQGSALFLDNLQLWAQQAAVADTCSAVFNLHVINVDTTSATIGWAFEGNVFDFEVEYGAHGFAQGSGTTLHPSESFLYLTDLQPDTYYDIYVRCGCGNDLWGDWAMMTFHTDILPSVIDDSVGIHNYVNYEVKIYPNPAHGHCTLHFGQELPKVVRLYSIDGALLKEWIPQKETMELRLPESGAFMLYCETKSGVVVRKVVNR